MQPATRHKTICHSYYVLFGMLGGGLVPALIKSWEDTFRLSHAAMGLCISAAAVGFATAAVLGGIIYDRWGPRAVMTWTAGLTAVGAAALALAPNRWTFLPALIAFQIANGLGCCINALVGGLYGAQRARGVSLLHASQGLGRLIAPQMVALSVLLWATWRPTFLLSAALMAAWAALFFVGLRDLPAHLDRPHAHRAHGGRPRPHWSVFLGLSGFVFVAGTEAGAVVWVPNYLESEVHLPKAQALLSLTWLMAGLTLMRLWLGFTRRRTGARVIVPASLAAAGGLLAMRQVDTVLAAHALALGLGVAFGGFWPCLTALLYDRVAHGHGLLTGGVIVTSAAGGMLVIPLMGYIGDVESLRAALLLPAGAALLYMTTYVLYDVIAPRPPAAAPSLPPPQPGPDAWSA